MALLTFSNQGPSGPAMADLASIFTDCNDAIFKKVTSVGIDAEGRYMIDLLGDLQSSWERVSSTCAQAVSSRKERPDRPGENVAKIQGAKIIYLWKVVDRNEVTLKKAFGFISGSVETWCGGTPFCAIAAKASWMEKNASKQTKQSVVTATSGRDPLLTTAGLLHCVVAAIGEIKAHSAHWSQRRLALIEKEVHDQGKKLDDVIEGRIEIKKRKISLPSTAIPNSPASSHVWSDAALNEISTEYSFDIIKEATQNFAKHLGSGTFGAVFEGSIAGTQVAVKRFELEPDLKEFFEAEVTTQSKYRHAHIVTLMGIARHGTNRYVVFEHCKTDLESRMSNGTAFLATERVKACAGSAKGLAYLHFRNVFHRDVKPSNVLCDDMGTWKLGDFGFSFESPGENFMVQRRSGTDGYACPDYVNTGLYSTCSDCYSYGVLLIVVLTSVPAVCFNPATQSYEYLVEEISDDFDKLVDLADPRAAWNNETIELISMLSLQCTQPQKKSRPMLEQVVAHLAQLP